jgi:uncharacterized protein with GYD domain
MATYILLMNLTPEGQLKALQDPDYLLLAEAEISVAGVQTLGVYAVLGPYDFVTLVEAPSNEVVARFSIELGVKAGVHITTLPVVPASRLEDVEQVMEAETAVDISLDTPVMGRQIED